MVLGQSKDAHVKPLEAHFGSIIDALELTDIQRRFLRLRWLDQLVWFEEKAASNQRRYYTLRMVTIVGAVVVPAIVSLNVREDHVATTLAWITFGVSLVVALAAALEAFFHFGERWHIFRRTSEGLKTQGWQFFELAGPFAHSSTHAGAFAAFAARVEALLQQDVDTFIRQIALEHPPEGGAGDHPEGRAPARPSTTKQQ
jgi:hypothetical protein